MARLTQEEVEKRIKEKYGNKYIMLSEYTGRRDKAKFWCNIHEIEFESSGESYLRRDKSFHICPQCKRDLSRKKSNVVCAYCGVEFRKKPSSLDNSKSGLYFCCREHKDLGQRLENGLTEIWPDHYNSNSIGVTTYRREAFRNFKHECAVCKWDKDARVLQVHHLDSNRDNNTLENLIILCPTCHWGITLKLYDLIKNNNEWKLIDKMGD